MASQAQSSLPLRLLGRRDSGEFYVFDTRGSNVEEFDIISYTWGDKIAPYDPSDCGITGVDWGVILKKEKLEEMKRLMITAGVQYLWVDCLCIKQTDAKEKAGEIFKMFQYYKRARQCHILVDMPEVWYPQDIVDDLKFIDHMLSIMGGAALASEAQQLTEKLGNRLSLWTEMAWNFPLQKSVVQSAAVDMGIINCYSTCTKHVRRLFESLYFSRVWTFQEMILGKNITMWGVNYRGLSDIGELRVWMDLATDSVDKALKLRDWIQGCRYRSAEGRYMNTEAIDNILRVLEEDILRLVFLKVQVMGITSARTDIINGGPNWWVENYRGVSNIFSAISITERNCYDKVDLFKGLLGIFSGLFSQEEIEQFGDDMDQISFSFFKRLSTKTGYGWTKLAISSRERGEWDWIPVVENNEGMKNTNCFAGVIMLGDLKKNGQTKVAATTSIKGTPRKYLKIVLRRGEGDFRFVFKGCNCGKKVKTGTFSSEQIPGHSAPRNVYMDETGRTLVQCATILGSLLDPNNDVVAYRTRLLGKLLPMWKISDPNAKPKGWIDRCVSGTPWEQPTLIRPHNLSMNYNLVDIDGCGSRLANETTQNILCQVTLNCGCDITAPFSFIFEAITAVEGSSLGATAVDLDRDNRIILQDGLGLVQAGEVGRAYNLIAFGGDVNAHKTHASSCRSTKAGKPLPVQLKWPIGRALVREEFSHDLSNMMRNYGYVDTNGSGNLLICRNHPLDPYRIIGVCIDKYIENEKGGGTVTIR